MERLFVDQEVLECLQQEHCDEHREDNGSRNGDDIITSPSTTYGYKKSPTPTPPPPTTSVERPPHPLESPMNLLELLVSACTMKKNNNVAAKRSAVKDKESSSDDCTACDSNSNSSSSSGTAPTVAKEADGNNDENIMYSSSIDFFTSTNLRAQCDHPVENNNSDSLRASLAAATPVNQLYTKHHNLGVPAAYYFPDLSTRSFQSANHPHDSDDDSTTALGDESQASKRSKTGKGDSQQKSFRSGLSSRRPHHHSTKTASDNKSSSSRRRRATKRSLAKAPPPPPPPPPPPCSPPARCSKTRRLLPVWTHIALQQLVASTFSSRQVLNPEEIRKRSAFLFLCLCKSALCLVRAGMYYALHYPQLVAFLPATYVFLVVANVLFLVGTKNYHNFVRRQLVLTAACPLVEHVALGGWQASGGVVLWSLLAPLIAALFQSSRTAIKWFQVVLLCVLPLLMFEVLQTTFTSTTGATTIASAMTTTSMTMTAMNVLGTMSISFAAAFFWSKSIEKNQGRSHGLVNQFLPENVASRLLQRGQRQGPILQKHDHVSLLSVRVIGGRDAKHQDAVESAWSIAKFLNKFFHGMDESIQQKRPITLTKVNTMGTVYLVAAGLEDRNDQQQPSSSSNSSICAGDEDHSAAASTTCGADNHTAELLGFAAELFPLLDKVNRRLGTSFEIRMGLHVGPVVAGVLLNDNKKKKSSSSSHQQLSYDVWGTTVDMAQNLQLQSLSACGGLVHLSQGAYDKVRHLENLYLFASRDGGDSPATAARNGKKKKPKTRTYFCKPKNFTSSSSSTHSLGSYVTAVNTTTSFKKYR